MPRFPLTPDPAKARQWAARLALALVVLLVQTTAGLLLGSALGYWLGPHRPAQVVIDTSSLPCGVDVVVLGDHIKLEPVKAQIWRGGVVVLTNRGYGWVQSRPIADGEEAW